MPGYMVYSLGWDIEKDTLGNYIIKHTSDEIEIKHFFDRADINYVCPECEFVIYLFLDDNEVMCIHRPPGSLISSLFMVVDDEDIEGEFISAEEAESDD